MANVNMIQGLQKDSGSCERAVQVDQPLCVECAAKVVAQVDAATRTAEREAAAYEAALARLRAEAKPDMAEPDFRVGLAAAQADERRERCAARLLALRMCTPSQNSQNLTPIGADLHAHFTLLLHVFNACRGVCRAVFVGVQGTS
jgi:hypothetical protein